MATDIWDQAAATLSPAKPHPAGPDIFDQAEHELKAAPPPRPPTEEPEATISKAPERGFFDSMKDRVANSAIGHSLESGMPKVADLFGLHPTETVNSPTYEEHKKQGPIDLALEGMGAMREGIRKGYEEATTPKPSVKYSEHPRLAALEEGTQHLKNDVTERMLLLKSPFANLGDAAQSVFDPDPKSAGVGHLAVAGGRTLEGLTQPENLALMATPGGVSKLAVPIFAAKALEGAGEEGAAAKEEYSRGNKGLALQHGMGAATNLAFAGMAAKGGHGEQKVKAEETPSIPVEKQEVAPEPKVLPAEAAAAPEAKPAPIELKPGQTTKDAHTHPIHGDWVPERAAMHDAVIERDLGGHKSQEKPTAWILGGGTASGKTTLSRKILGEQKDVVRLDPDEKKLDIPEYEGLKKSSPETAAAQVHDESSYLTKRELAEAAARKLNFTYDTTSTGDPSAKIDLVNWLKSKGYTVKVMFADVPVDEAIKRADKRARESKDPMNKGRFVPPEVIREIHGQVARSFEAMKEHADEAHLYDNTGKQPEAVYQRFGSDPEKIYNQERYEQFRQKGAVNEAQAQEGAVPGSRSGQGTEGRPGSGTAVPGGQAGGLFPAESGAASPTGEVVTGSGRVARVPLKDISTDEANFQPREKLDPDRVASIAANMKERGAFGDEEPITLYEHPNGKTVVLEGHHRLAAAQKAGLDSATARVLSDMNPEEAADYARRSNSKAAPLTPMEQARAFEKEATGGRSNAEIGQAYGGITEGKVDDLRSLTKLPAELQKRVQDGTFDPNKAVVLARAAERHQIPPEIQQQAFDYVVKRKDITPAQFKTLLDTFAPAAMKQEGFGFGAQQGFEGMTGFKGLATAMDEYNAQVRALASSRNRLRGFVNEIERRQREGVAVPKATVSTKNAMVREVKKAETKLTQMATDAGSGKLYKTLGQAIEEGKKLPAGERTVNAEAERATLRGTDAQTPLDKMAEPQVKPAEFEPKEGDTASLGAPETKENLRRREPTVKPEDSLALPGMENVDQERGAARAAAEGEQLTQDLNAPKADISRQSGEMERESPLFRGSDASGMGDLFDQAERETKLEDTRAPIGESIKPQGALFTGTAVADPAVVRGIFPNMASWLRDRLPIWDDTASGREKAIIREKSGRMAREQAKAYEALKSFSRSWSTKSTEASREFFKAMESGAPEGLDAKGQQLAGTLRTLLDDRRTAIQELGTGKLENFIQDYFPHIWEDPASAATKIKQMLQGKRPFQGSADFLKQRTIDTIEEGIKAGLTPITWNPVDLAMLKIREMDRYLMAHQVLHSMKDAGLAKFIKFGDEAPEGWGKLNDSMFRVLEPNEGAGGMVLRGEYWAPREASRILNNHLSSGLAGDWRYDLFRGVSNTLNQAQLGLSAFHLGFTTVDASVSDLALAIERASRGDVKGAVMPAIKSFVPTLSGITNFAFGRRLMAEYLKPGSYAELSKLADSIERAGGRAQQDWVYRNNGLEKMLDKWKEGSYAQAALKVPGMAIEQMARPIMEYIVPRQKLGIFGKLAGDVLERSAKDDWSQARTRSELQKAWDSVDNRMGQVVYDNLFWNRVSKDLALVSVRSVGWNLGTIREVGGAALDTAKQGGRILAGQKAEVTHRMAYAMALPIITGSLGALYNFVATGQAPQDLKDYFFPKTGRKLPNGDAERVSLPSYMKDIYGAKHAPVEMIGHKLHPAVSGTIDFLKNEDYYGNEIRHPGDPLVQQVIDAGKFVAGQFLPFSARNYQQRHKSGGGAGAFAQSMVGITPSPGYITRSDAEELAHSYRMREMPQGPRTSDDVNKSDRRHDYEAKLRNGEVTLKDLANEVKAGKITAKDAAAIRDNQKSGGLVSDFRSLSLPAALEVWEKASAEEKKQIRTELVRKQAKLRDYLPERQKALRAKLNESLGMKGTTEPIVQTEP